MKYLFRRTTLSKCYLKIAHGLQRLLQLLLLVPLFRRVRKPKQGTPNPKKTHVQLTRLTKRRLLRRVILRPLLRVLRRLGYPFHRFLVIPFLKRARDPAPEEPDPKRLQARKKTLIHIGTWEWLSALALISAFGLIIIAYGYAISRNSGPSRLRNFMYPGIILLFMPTAARMINPSTPRIERITMLCISGIYCYLIKVLTSPIHFYLFDEFLHWRTANDIIASGHLLTPNALLPVSPYYPGLEIVTLAFSMMSGLDVFHSALLLICIARLMMTLTLFTLNESLFRSARVGSIATVFYMINPHYIFFDTQYAYESLALPIALVIFLVMEPYQGLARQMARLNAVVASTLMLEGSATTNIVARRSKTRSDLRGTKLMGLIVMSSVTFTHHASDFFFIALIGMWAALYRMMHLAAMFRSFLSWLILFELALSITWINAPNNPVLPYLLGFLSSVFGHSKAGHFVPKVVNSFSALPWEKNLAQNGSYFTMAIVPIGVLCVWQRYRSHALVRMLSLTSLGLPASYVLRSSDNGIQLADRASAVLFVAVSAVLAVLITQLWPVRTFHWYHNVLITLTMVLLFMGGYILSGGSGYGSPPTPYVVGADSRSIEIKGIQASTWMGTYLGPNNHVGSDRTNQLLVATFGSQRVIDSIADHIDVAPLYFDSPLKPEDILLMKRAELSYMLIDLRLSTALPAVGAYIEKEEPGAMEHDAPIPLANLIKFNTMPRVNKVFDGGDMQVYDVRGYVHARQTP